MKPLLSLRIIIRSPVRSALVFVLLAASAFGLASRAGEYYITSRTLEQATVLYAPVGYVSGDLSAPLDESILKTISASRNVSLSDARSSGAGESEYYRLHEAAYPVTEGDGFSNALAVVEMASEPMPRYRRAVLGDLESDYRAFEVVVNFRIVRAIIGSPTVFYPDRFITIYINMTFPYEFDTPEWQAYYDYLMSLEADTEYVVSLEVLYDIYATGHTRVSFDLDYLTFAPAPFRPFIKADEYTDALTDQSAASNADITQHTLDIIYAKTMDILPKRAEGLFFYKQGRALSERDSANKSNVCVISSQLAAAYGLSVGDTVALGLRKVADTRKDNAGNASRNPHFFAGAYWSFADTIFDTSAYAEPAKTVELEIVGVFIHPEYKRTDLLHYGPNTVFVPDWLKPSTVNSADYPYTFSFRLTSFDALDDFNAEMAQKLPGVEFKMFSRRGWEDVRDGLVMMQKISLLGFIFMAAAMALSVVLVVYLFIVRKKKEYAVMRVLGVTKTRAGAAQLFALLAIAFPAVAFGAGLAAVFSNFAGTGLDLTEAGGLPTTFTLYVAGAILAAQLAVAAVGLWANSRKSPLALIQEVGR